MGTTKTSKHSKNKHQHKVLRYWKWPAVIVGVILALTLLLLVSFRITPWPGSMIIRLVFESNGRKTTEALQAHEPTGVLRLGNQQYITGDKDAQLDVYIPESVKQNEKKLPVVIWTHGGAWISGSKTDAAPYFKLLAKAGYTVIAPDYTLAPEKAYPTQIHQLNSLYEYIQKNSDRFYADTNKIVLAGDSAGSQLSAQMAALITNSAYAQEVGITPALKSEQLKGIILTCGIYKMEALARPGADVAPLISWGDDTVVWAYSGTRDFSAPVIRQMSPYYHATKDFPATFVTGGNDDPLTDVQSKPFADELEGLGVSVTRLFYPKDHQPKLPHEYQFNLDTADGRHALEQIIDFINTNTK
jgi:acetyl esterase